MGFDQIVILEVFAGTARVTSCLKQLGFDAFGVDFKKPKNVCGPVVVLDLTDSHDVSQLWSWLQNPKVKAIFMAPPSGTASRARAANLKRKHPGSNNPVGHKFTPLRTDRHPNGIPGLSYVNRFRVSQSNKIFDLTARIVKFCVLHGIVVAVLSPQFSFFWATTFWTQVAKLMRYTVFHACQYGSLKQKKTMLAYFDPAGQFALLNKRCPGESQRHRHDALVAQKNLPFADDSTLPFALARIIAQCFMSIFAALRACPPPCALEDLHVDSPGILQSLRASTGTLVKASKLPPLVPSFACKKHVVDSPANLPDIPIMSKLHNAFEHLSSCTTIPSGAKLLAVSPALAKNGGSDEEQGRSGNVKQAKDLIHQTWGIPWTPHEFVANAHKAGHPLSLVSNLPPVLKEVIKLYSCTNAAQRAQLRTSVCKSWVVRARQLHDSEVEFKKSLHSDAQVVLKQKRLLLYKELLQQAEYPDMQVFDEFCHGTKLTGRYQATGLWPSKLKPATMTEDKLREIACLERRKILQSTLSCGDPVVDKAVWDQTIAEVSAGNLVGPFCPNSIPPHCPLSRRFGIVQGHGRKIRCVDDFSRSAVNQAAETSESPRPHTLDVFAAMTLEAMRCQQGQQPWVGRTFDLRQAYRQCCVHASSQDFGHIIVFNPMTKLPAVFRMRALPFGSLLSVHGFLRVALSLWFVACKLLGVLWCSFFDDFLTVCETSESENVTQSIHLLFSLLGWDFARTGEKAPPFCQEFLALGVKVDLSRMHLSSIRIDNTDARKTEMSGIINEALSTGELRQRDALRLRGRMQFTAGQLYGRFARTCLAAVTSHAYTSGNGKLSESTRRALLLYERLLNAQKPRLLRADVADTWIIFTDACYEPDPAAGLGGVLVDPSGKAARFFSVRLCDATIRKLNPNGKKSIIYTCEFLAVLVALKCWQKVIYGRQIVGVRDALISCHTTNSMCSCILQMILQLEEAACLLPWYARVASAANVSDAPSRFDCSDPFLSSACQDIIESSFIPQLLEELSEKGGEKFRPRATPV